MTLAAITAHTGQEHREPLGKVWFSVWAKEPGTEKTECLLLVVSRELPITPRGRDKESLFPWLPAPLVE